MNGRGLAAAVSIACWAFTLTASEAQAQRFDMGGFAGGVLGGAIAGAMIGNAQGRPAVVYRSRRVYAHAPQRHAERRYAAAPRPRSGNPATAAVVDASTDPFAAKASATSLPIVAK